MTDYSSRPGGALFAKDPAKKTNQNQPDFDGYVVLDPAVMATLTEAWKQGQPLRLELAGWKKNSQRGTSFLSLSAKLPREGRQQPQRQAPPVGGGFGFDDDDAPPF